MAKPVYGAIVQCPADRGEPAYRGSIRHISTTVQTNIRGVRYVWVTVQKMHSQTRHVWPSHRLGLDIA